MLGRRRHDTGELDAEGQEVLAQLRRAARQLLGMVSLTSGAAAATRMADVRHPGHMQSDA